eukprot:TRINITY_DN15102_c0_g1_i1.p1 TRINITY_DN15102_c0_g1~~TRINITY_DN15102_c0_g1_i1.p1  ORF type:complete len:358 (+),score=61.52 TRINITY_DN15102_c0_g1_i1:230-1303(+)
MACNPEVVGHQLLQRSPLLLQTTAQTGQGVTPWLHQVLLSLAVDDPRAYMLPQPLVNAFCIFTGAESGDDDTAVLISLLLVLSSGALHAVAMAMRKYYGEGHRSYWLNCQWWLGVICDGLAGMVVWPAMPVISVQLLVPVCTVVQLSVGYLLGIFMFKEQVAMANHAGLCLAGIGVVGLGFSGENLATDSELSLAQWVQPSFLKAFACCLAVVLGTFALNMPRAASWAMAAGLAEAVQFLASRSLADVVMRLRSGVQPVSLPLLVPLVVIKIFSIIGSLHCQQVGFKGQLSRFVGIFLVLTNLLTVVLGLSFFADKVTISVGFLSSAFVTLAGIWLLNKDESTDKELQDGDSASMES